MKYNSHITLFGYVKDGNPHPPKKIYIPRNLGCKGKDTKLQEFPKVFPQNQQC